MKVTTTCTVRRRGYDVKNPSLAVAAHGGHTQNFVLGLITPVSFDQLDLRREECISWGHSDRVSEVGANKALG